MKTVTFLPHDKKYADLYLKLDSYRKTISGNLYANYQPERFNLDNMVALSITYNDDKILFFSSIFRRPEWHPSVVRLLNRTYKDESVRVKLGNAFEKMKEKKPITTFLTDQFSLAKELKYTNFIISREKNSKNMLQFYLKWCKDATKKDWIYHDQKVWTCPSISGPSCNQNIIYYSEKNDFNPATMLCS
jgi:hypothetical protein